MLPRPPINDPEDIVRRLEGLENELRNVRQEAAELRAAHDDAIELALIGAVPNTIFRLINDARINSWTITYSRRSYGEGCGTIHLIHPAGEVHDYSFDLPLPDDPPAQRRIETDLRMRIGWTQAA